MASSKQIRIWDTALVTARIVWIQYLWCHMPTAKFGHSLVLCCFNWSYTARMKNELGLWFELEQTMACITRQTDLNHYIFHLCCLCYDKVCSLMSTTAYLKRSNEPDYYHQKLLCCPNRICFWTCHNKLVTVLAASELMPSCSYNKEYRLFRNNIFMVWVQPRIYQKFYVCENFLSYGKLVYSLYVTSY